MINSSSKSAGNPRNILGIEDYLEKLCSSNLARYIDNKFNSSNYARINSSKLEALEESCQVVQEKTSMDILQFYYSALEDIPDIFVLYIEQERLPIPDTTDFTEDFIVLIGISKDRTNVYITLITQEVISKR